MGFDPHFTEHTEEERMTFFNRKDPYALAGQAAVDKRNAEYKANDELYANKDDLLYSAYSGRFPAWEKQWTKEMKPFLGRNTAKMSTSDGTIIYPQRNGLGYREQLDVKRYATRAAKLSLNNQGIPFDDVMSDVRFYEYRAYAMPGIKGELRDYLPERFFVEEYVDWEKRVDEDGDLLYKTGWDKFDEVGTKIAVGIGSGFLMGGPVGALVDGLIAGAEVAYEEVTAPPIFGEKNEERVETYHNLITGKTDDDTENMRAMILNLETAEQKKSRLKNNGGIREATLRVMNGPKFAKWGDGALERQIYLHKYGPDSLNLPEDKRAIQEYRRSSHYWN